MRKLLLIIILAAVAVISLGLSAFAGEDKSSGQVIAYYFHGNFRCASCHAIEKYTKEALNDNFKDQIGSGELVIKVVNVEEKGNEHFVKDYKLYTKSVVLSLIQNGKETRFKNLEQVWQLLGNKDKFYKYIKNETQKFLDSPREDDQL